jgi:hypothetical protein
MRMLLVLALLLGVQTARAEESLCVGHEKIVFSCHLGRTILSLCRPLESPRGLTYRYGTPAHVEVVYPSRGPEEQGRFYTSSAPLFGGGETTLAFTRADYEYKIYSKIGRADRGESQEDRTPIFEDGLVISQSGKPVRHLVCDDGGEGFREDISWLPHTPLTDQAPTPQ